MRNYILSAVVVAAAAVAPAQATTVPTIIFTANTFTLPAYVTGSTSLQNFEGFAVGQTPPGSFGNVTVEQGSVPNSFLDPDPNSTNKYLSVTTGLYTVAFAPAQVFSFVLGSLDRYNSVKLSFSDGTFQTLTGAGIIGQADPGTPSPNFGQAGRVTYDMGGGSAIIGAQFHSAQPSFEIDDLVTAAPEPATWGMMILGFGLAGAQLRSRRRSAKLAVA
jgi:hypothetical protein